MAETEKKRDYQITEEHCRNMIKGVCEGCGGKLEPIETVDNAGQPTFWVGCKKCMCFRSGVERKYWEIARLLIDEGELIPYSHMRRMEYENSPERLDYWLSSQTAGLSHKIQHIDKLLKGKTPHPQKGGRGCSEPTT